MVIGSHQKLLADSYAELNIKSDNHAVVFLASSTDIDIMVAQLQYLFALTKASN